jgi:subtilisin family serine protease
MKPDVCAPGVNIVSAQNFFIDDDTYFDLAEWDICSLDTEYETWGGLSGFFHMMAQTGTSMSAPVVTGTVALWMQADPTLTTEKIKDVIAHSSRQPDNTLTYPNNQYGYGEIDAYEGLKYVIAQASGIEDITRETSAKGEGRGYYTLDGRRLANKPTAKGLYIVNGKKVMF